MKFLIVFACALAAASAGYVTPVAYYAGAQHLPVIGPNGVPVDTAEVQHARAAHYAHKVEAHARNGDYAVATPFVAATYAHAAPVVATSYAAYHPSAYPTTAVLPSSVNGVPLETPEVVAAKTHHFAAHAEALARSGHAAVVYRHRRALYATSPVAYSAYSAPVAYSAYSHATPVVASAYSHPYSYPSVATSYSHPLAYY